ncbi:MAG: capsule assembly Wzi family protein, partial [FCB group bacterium]|nr:capsule assembly Wzi family protein [FCB group bacterium]
MKIGFSTVVGFLTAALVLLPALTTAAVIIPLGHSPFDFEYERFYRAGVAAQGFDYLPSTGPFLLNQVEEIFNIKDNPAIDLLEINNTSSLRLLGIGSERYVTARHRQGDDLPVIRAGYTARLSRYFSLLALVSMDRGKAIDPEYTGKKYRGLAGEVETAGLFFQNDDLHLALGRFRTFWGPQKTNLLLSHTAEPLDQLSARYEKGRLILNFLFARLDGSHPNAADSLRFPGRSFSDNRYLAGHRLDIRFHKRFRAGFFETVLFGGEGRPPELYYLNPLQFFHSAQLNENEDDNTILGFDFTALLGKGASAYGQILIDDFQIDDASQGDQEPNEMAYMLGLFKTGRVGTFLPDLKIEYVRIANRTYHQADPRNRYIYRNKLLGHPLGPDADSLSFKARFWPSDGFFAEIEFAYRRKGEGSIEALWDEPWL